jgi:hypothetical protein
MAGWGGSAVRPTVRATPGWGGSTLHPTPTPVTPGWFPAFVRYFQGDGSLTTTLVQQMLATAGFAGTGNLQVAISQLQNVRADFWSSGTLVTDATGDKLPFDGLYMEWLARYLLAANFVSDGQLAMTIAQIQTLSTGFDGSGNLTSIMDYPTFAPSSVYYISNATYTIPYWCRYIDVIALGGGGGGSGGYGSYFNGNGGGQGTDVAKFGTYTLTRGSNLPWTTATLSVTVGTGGAGGSGGSTIFDVPTPPDGLPSGVSGIGLSFIGGAGGKGADKSVTRPRQGLSPGNVTYNGIQYVGGGETTSSTAQVPGSGGYGGNGGFFSGSSGYAGGRGQVWLRARQ